MHALIESVHKVPFKSMMLFSEMICLEHEHYATEMTESVGIPLIGDG